MIRTTVPLLFVVAAASVFLYDGFVGYPLDNATKFVESLGLSDGADPVVNPELTADRGQALAARFPNGAALDELKGEVAGTPVEHGRDTYFVGPGGQLHVRHVAGRIEQIGWVDGTHSETDITLQRWLGYGLIVLGLGFVGQLIRVLRTRVCVSDSGLQIGGAAVIPFESMKMLRYREPGLTGEMALEYATGERTNVVVLDRYVIRHFDEIITAICERAGLSHPAQADDDVRLTDAPTEQLVDKG